MWRSGSEPSENNTFLLLHRRFEFAQASKWDYIPIAGIRRGATVILIEFNPKDRKKMNRAPVTEHHMALTASVLNPM